MQQKRTTCHRQPSFPLNCRFYRLTLITIIVLIFSHLFHPILGDSNNPVQVEVGQLFEDININIGAERHRSIETEYCPINTFVNTDYPSIPIKSKVTMDEIYGVKECQASFKVILLQDFREYRTVCLYRDEDNHDIFEQDFSIHLDSMAITVKNLYHNTQSVSGFLVDEPNSVVQGYLIKQKFYGTIRMFDKYRLYHIVFYVEPISNVRLYDENIEYQSLPHNTKQNAVLFEYLSNTPNAPWSPECRIPPEEENDKSTRPTRKTTTTTKKIKTTPKITKTTKATSTTRKMMTTSPKTTDKITTNVETTTTTAAKKSKTTTETHTVTTTTTEISTVTTTTSEPFTTLSTKLYSLTSESTSTTPEMSMTSTTESARSSSTSTTAIEQSTATEPMEYFSTDPTTSTLTLIFEPSTDVSVGASEPKFSHTTSERATTTEEKISSLPSDSIELLERSQIKNPSKTGKRGRKVDSTALFEKTRKKNRADEDSQKLDSTEAHGENEKQVVTKSTKETFTTDQVTDYFTYISNRFTKSQNKKAGQIKYFKKLKKVVAQTAEEIVHKVMEKLDEKLRGDDKEDRNKVVPDVPHHSTKQPTAPIHSTEKSATTATIVVDENMTKNKKYGRYLNQTDDKSRIENKAEAIFEGRIKDLAELFEKSRIKDLLKTDKAYRHQNQSKIEEITQGLKIADDSQSKSKIVLQPETLVTLEVLLSQLLKILNSSDVINGLDLKKPKIAPERPSSEKGQQTMELPKDGVVKPHPVVKENQVSLKRKKRDKFDLNNFFGDNLVLTDEDHDVNSILAFKHGVTSSDIFDLRRTKGLVCTLCIWIQPNFALNFGLGGGPFVGISEVIDLIKFTNWIFRSIDFNQDGIPENIGLSIKSILVSENFSSSTFRDDNQLKRKRRRRSRTRNKNFEQNLFDKIGPQVVPLEMPDFGPGDRDSDSVAQLMQKIREIAGSYETLLDDLKPQRRGQVRDDHDINNNLNPKVTSNPSNEDFDQYDYENKEDSMKNSPNYRTMEGKLKFWSDFLHFDRKPRTTAAKTLLQSLTEKLQKRFPNCCAILGFVYHNLFPSYTATNIRGLCTAQNVALISGFFPNRKLGKFDVFRGLMHVLGHLFGAPHDRVHDLACNDRQLYNFLNPFPLHPLQQTNVGARPNSLKFSPCARDKMTMFLSSNGASCLKPDSKTVNDGSGFCGDGVQDDDEDCDCGSPWQCNLKSPCCGERDSVQGCKIVKLHEKSCHRPTIW